MPDNLIEFMVAVAAAGSKSERDALVSRLVGIALSHSGDEEED